MSDENGFRTGSTLSRQTHTQTHCHNHNILVVMETPICRTLTPLWAVRANFASNRGGVFRALVNGEFQALVSKIQSHLIAERYLYRMTDLSVLLLIIFYAFQEARGVTKAEFTPPPPTRKKLSSFVASGGVN